MARTSKKKKEEQLPLSRRFHVGIYARLSVDGTERKNESIDTQISIVKQYLKKHPDMELYDCYTDLGKTGTNFKREGFERMMQDVRKKRIDCVIVKDLSRFGRNHIETGNYVQKIFPFMGVRFIALTDGIDTFEAKSDTDEMTVNLKNLVNEMYARDISVKVKSSRRSSQEQGSYTGGLPPYGYRAEWVNGKKCLFICQKTSEIVKEIYELFLSGNNMRQITRVLYEREIHRPSVYRKTRHVYRQTEEILEQWPACTIKFILTNPVYTGCLVQGTTCGKQYKYRSHHNVDNEDKYKSCHNVDNEDKYKSRHDVDSGDFTLRHGTHEPLISEEMFFRAAAIFEKSAAKYCNTHGFSKKVPLEEDIYAGVLFCGNCGKQLARTANIKQLASGDMVRHYGYYCPASRRMDDLQCQTKSIGMSALEKLVKNALHQEFALSDLRPIRLVKECEKQAEEIKQRISLEIVQCEKLQENRKKRGSELYLKYHMGSISLEEFQQRKKENTEAIHKIAEKQEKLQRSLESADQELKEKEKLLRNLMKCSQSPRGSRQMEKNLGSLQACPLGSLFRGNEKTTLTKDVIHTLINRINVYADHRVKITFAFRMNDLLLKKCLPAQVLSKKS